MLKIGRIAMSALNNGLRKKTPAQRSTVGIIVIGDEILKGSTKDVNSTYMCRELHDRGVVVKKIVVVGDEIDEIANEVKLFSEQYDVVFTTGGIGPTHDDCTFAGIAKAFDDKLVLNEELLTVVNSFVQKRKISDSNIQQAIDKFCKIPKSAKLIWGNDSNNANNSDKLIDFVPKVEIEKIEVTGENGSTYRFPSFQIKNVIALPGVPSFCKHTFDYLKEYLFPNVVPFYSWPIFLSRSEIHLEYELTKIANIHNDYGVLIGSYPMDNSYFKTKLIVECDSHELGYKAYSQLLETFKDFVVDYDETPWINSYEKLMKFRSAQSKEFQEKIDESLKVCDEILDQYRLDDTWISFNGGKDCTVLLHLFRCCIDRRFGEKQKIYGFHVLCDDEFMELREFVADIAEKYSLDVKEIKACMKQGLSQLQEKHPNVVAILMGSRSTDPKGKFMKSKCEWTDSDWPRFYRVCPVRDWSYAEVWRALRGLSIPYCKLYDMGFTSLGERSTTFRNPALLTKEGTYLPAYLLHDEHLERCARECNE